MVTPASSENVKTWESELLMCWHGKIPSMPLLWHTGGHRGEVRRHDVLLHCCYSREPWKWTRTLLGRRRNFTHHQLDTLKQLRGRRWLRFGSNGFTTTFSLCVLGMLLFEASWARDLTPLSKGWSTVIPPLSLEEGDHLKAPQDLCLS